MYLAHSAPVVTADTPTSIRRTRAQRGTLWLLIAVVWIAAVACGAAIAAFGHVSEILAIVRSNATLRPSLLAGLLLIGIPVVLAVVVGHARIGPPHIVALAVAASIAPVLLWASGQMLQVVIALALLLPPCVVGRLIVERCLRSVPLLDAWVLGCALGLGLLGAVTAALGAVGLVGWRSTCLLTLLMAIVATLAGRKLLRRDLARLVVWLRASSTLPLAQRVQLGLIVGAGWLTLFSMLIPEVFVDAVASRLPAAEYVAKSGWLGTRSDLLVTVRPGLSELIYAAVLTVGDLEAPKAVSMFVGWLSIAGVAAIARHLGGRRAALPAALTLASLPVMLRTLESTSADIFAVLYAVAVGLVFVQPGGMHWRSVLLAGVCGLLGLAVKASFATVAVGFVVAAPLMLTGPGHTARRMRVGVLVGLLLTMLLAVAVAANLNLVSRALTPLNLGGSDWTSLGNQIERHRLALGERLSPTALLRSPLDLTFRTAQFAGTSAGGLGYLLLALAPLAVPSRSHQLNRLVVSVTAAYLTWFWSTQYVRYGLPLFALCCALSGVAVARLHCPGRHRLMQLVDGLIPFIAACGFTSYILTTLIWPSLPWTVVLGLESREAFLRRALPEYGALSLLDAEHGTKLAAVVGDALPQLYSQTALNPILLPRTWAANPTPSPLRDTGTLLHLLDLLGYTHILVNQARAEDWWSNNASVDPDFLKGNTVLIGAERGVYVYRILPPEQRGQGVAWVLGPELLPNGDLHMGEDGIPRDWSFTGTPWAYQRTDQGSANGGAVAIRSASDLVTTVNLTPGREYLLTVRTHTTQGRGWVRVLIEWQNDAGQAIGVAGEALPAGDGGYRDWWTLASAPSAASKAAIQIQAVDGEVWLSRVSLRSHDDR